MPQGQKGIWISRSWPPEESTFFPAAGDFESGNNTQLLVTATFCWSWAIQQEQSLGVFTYLLKWDRAEVQAGLKGCCPASLHCWASHTACSSSIKPHSITFSTGTDSHHHSQRWLTKGGVRRQMLIAVQTLEFCLSFKSQKHQVSYLHPQEGSSWKIPPQSGSARGEPHLLLQVMVVQPWNSDLTGTSPVWDVRQSQHNPTN